MWENCVQFIKKKTTNPATKSVSSGNSELEISPSVTPADEDDECCLFCDRKFSENNKWELWVTRIMCPLWAHVDCTGAEKYVYTCDFCR